LSLDSVHLVDSLVAFSVNFCAHDFLQLILELLQLRIQEPNLLIFHVEEMLQMKDLHDEALTASSHLNLGVFY